MPPNDEKFNDDLQTKRNYINSGISNGYNIILADPNTKRPIWMGKTASTYTANVNDLLSELNKHPNLGYGIVLGKQLKDFYLVCLDIDIDTDECKERISKELEELLSKHNIKYNKEETKNKRIHIYIALDNLSDKIENIKKLPYSGTCVKRKNDRELPGEVELLTKNKVVVVYNGIINNEKPFFVEKAVVNDHRQLENALDEYISRFKPVESNKNTDKEKISEDIPETKPEKESEKKPKGKTKKNKPVLQFEKLVEAYRIIRKYNVFDGWEIEKVFSAYCVRNNIPTEQVMRAFEIIYGSEYDEKRTIWILNRTKKKDLELLPTPASVYYHINTVLNSGIELEAYEKAVLKAALNDLKRNGYSEYEPPEYLQNAENVILDYSLKMGNKKGEVYYKEGYFIEQNLNGIKKVVHVNIITAEKGGIYKYHTIDGKIKEVGIKADIIRLIREGKITAYEFLINDKEVYRPSFNFSKIDDVIHEISLVALPYTMLIDNSLYKRYLDRKIAEFIKENGEPTACVIGKQTGWSDDLKFFFHYGLDDKYHELSKEHILYKKNKAVIKNTEEQHRFVKAFLTEGKLLGVLLVASVSSLFIKPFGIPGITVIVAGHSGAGKTTSCLIATSLFYYSDDVLINAQTTRTGLELTISNLNSLPILVDEGALAFDLSLNDLVFMVNAGVGKARGRKDLSVDFKELKSNVFWTTETTDIDNLRRTGAFRRMLYLVVKSWNDLTEILETGHRINEEYAGCGVDYIKYAIEHMGDIKKAFKQETEDFSSKYKEITPIALNLYSGLVLLEKFYNARFDSLRETINKVLDEAKALFIENKENVVEKLKEFLNKWLHIHFHVLHPDGKIERAKQEAWGEYDLDEGVYYIRNDSWSEIARRLGKERKLLTKELKEAGLLTYKDYRHKATNEKIKTYIIKFNDDCEEKVEF
jgi:hypothetical protein